MVPSPEAFNFRETLNYAAARSPHTGSNTISQRDVLLFLFAFDKHRKWPLAKPLRACLVAVLHAKFLK